MLDWYLQILQVVLSVSSRHLNDRADDGSLESQVTAAACTFVIVQKKCNHQSASVTQWASVWVQIECLVLFTFIVFIYCFISQKLIFILEVIQCCSPAHLQIVCLCFVCWDIYRIRGRLIQFSLFPLQHSFNASAQHCTCSLKVNNFLYMALANSVNIIKCRRSALLSSCHLHNPSLNAHA